MGIAQSTFEELKSQIDGVHITFVADKDRAVKNFPGADIIPKGILGLGALIKTAHSSDLVVCGGGGLFQDDDSLIKMTYWGLRVLFVKTLGAKVVGYCLGVGPLTHAMSRFFGRLAFACMSAVSVRDPIAYQVAKGLTRRTVTLVPDPALALKPATAEEAEKLLQDQGVPRDGSPLIGVAMRKWFHNRGSLIPHKVAFRFGLRGTNGRNKLQKMTELLANVLDKLTFLHGAHIVFLPTYNVAHEGDDRVCEEIRRKMRSNRTSLIRISEPRLYKAVSRRA
ncbi:MAG: polysaccharide pyruvyl transferase family protein [Deltaproteobacteria bacterium]|nr:polysaccharide pyruvyl transferase family protein [Deltaproteobacteria bacterium]